MPDDIARGTNGQFIQGNRGGPGRPRSVVSRSSVALDQIGADMGERIVQMLADKALAGDVRAAELLLQRIWPSRRGRPAEIDAPPVKSLADYVPAAAGVANAVMTGEMTPHEGQALSRVLDTQIRAIDATDIERRLTELEDEARERKNRRAHEVDDPLTAVFDPGR